MGSIKVLCKAIYEFVLTCINNKTIKDKSDKFQIFIWNVNIDLQNLIVALSLNGIVRFSEKLQPQSGNFLNDPQS